MTPFKQALMQFKNTWKQSLLLGVGATAFIFLVNSIPLINAFCISLGILAFQSLAQKIVEKKRTFHITTKYISAYLIVSIVLLPSSILLGSAIGILQSPHEFTTSIPAAIALTVIALYFYFIFSQSLRYHLETNTSIGKSIDITAISSIKNIKSYLPPCLYFSFLIITAEPTKGITLVATLPLLFYANHFMHKEINEGK